MQGQIDQFIFAQSLKQIVASASDSAISFLMLAGLSSFVSPAGHTTLKHDPAKPTKSDKGPIVLNDILATPLEPLYGFFRLSTANGICFLEFLNSGTAFLA
jgi:hypothetical protein